MTIHSTAFRSRRMLIGVLPALVAMGAACSGARVTTTGEFGSESDVTRAVVPGLEQHVTLSPAELVTGENVEIHSVITNRGSTAVELESRICGLDLGGDLELNLPTGILVCAGHSIGGTIAPGESRQSSAIRRVSSPPGMYTLRVKHALRPELWVELHVKVRAP
jgi:hypothetical protein